MSIALQQFGIERLNTAERIELIGLIWDSVAEEAERTPLTEAQRAEVDRRLAAHDANPSAAIPWEQIEADARERLGQ